MDKQLEQLTEIAKKLSEYSVEEYGRGWNDVYTVPEIKCYFADNGNHKAVSIEGLQIGFFNPVQYELQLRHIAKLPQMIKDSRKALNTLLRQRKETDKAERERRKQEKIESLKKELEELSK